PPAVAIAIPTVSAVQTTTTAVAVRKERCLRVMFSLLVGCAWVEDTPRFRGRARPWRRPPDHVRETANSGVGQSQRDRCPAKHAPIEHNCASRDNQLPGVNAR